MRSFIRRREQALAFVLWAKSVFLPMYGQRDWQGRIISFCFRLLLLVTRGVRLLLWTLWAFVWMGLYCFFPIVVVYGIIIFLP